MSITTRLARWISNYDSRLSLGSKIRARRVAPLLGMIEDVSRQRATVKIIDIGGTERYWNIIPREFLLANNCKITIVNLPGSILPRDHDFFTFMQGDGCALTPFSDEEFDIAHSNSVLEHVGDWGRMVQFSRELARVSQRYFVQTPNYWFPVEPHCMTPAFHWLPLPTRVWLVRHFQLGHWKKGSSIDEAVRIVESARLINKKMLQELFSDATLYTERLLGLPKSFVAIKTD